MVLWTHKNIKAWIYKNDHCEPHVTFVCRADGWTARIRFNMVKPGVALVDVKPLKNAPSLAVLNLLANQLVQNLGACRMEWWLTKNGELCLDNKDVERLAPGKVLMDGPAPSGRIISKSAVYVVRPGIPGHVIASVRWSDGSITHSEIVE